MHSINPKILYQLNPQQLNEAILNGKTSDQHGNEINFLLERNDETKIQIRNVEVKGELKLKSLKCKYPVSFYQCRFESLSLDFCQFDNLRFFASTITEVFMLWGCSIKKDFVLRSCDLGRTVHIADLNASSFFVGNVLSSGGYVISNLNITEQFTWTKNKNLEACIVSNSYLNEIGISDDETKGRMLFVKVMFTKFTLDSLSEEFSMCWRDIQNLQNNSEITISKSILGMWELISCNLEASKLAIDGSKITNAFYTNSILPHKLSLPNGINVNRQQEHNILRDGYNQLKTIAQKQNDRKLFLHYQAEELASFYKSIGWFNNPTTKFQLCAMRISNDYGNSWFQSILFVAACNFVFLVLINIHRTIDLSMYSYFVAEYLTLLFSITTKPIQYISPWETSWFWISRIFIAFGVYQTIAAFRKFSKDN